MNDRTANRSEVESRSCEPDVPGVKRPAEPAENLSIPALATLIDSARQSLDAASGMFQRLTGGSVGSGAPLPIPIVESIPRWHFAMLNDFDRNDAFVAALERLVPAGSHVLDIGSGSGLLAMMAARAGAGHVTTCEGHPVLAELARQIIAREGLSGRITVIPKMSTDLQVGVDLPRRADLIVSEIVDCGLVGEGLLPTVRHAREYLLAPGGRLVPASASLFGMLVQSGAVNRLNRVSAAAGFDVSLFNQVSTPGHFPVRLSTWPHQVLSEPTLLTRFNFAADELLDGRAVVDIPITANGCAHALIVWFEMNLGAGVVVRNSPDNLASHWMQACLPLAEPVALQAGRAWRGELSWRGPTLTAHELTTPIDTLEKTP